MSRWGHIGGAAGLCGTTHKTVKRVIEDHEAGLAADRPRRRSPPKNTDGVSGVIWEKVRSTDGRISAKRLLPVAQAAAAIEVRLVTSGFRALSWVDPSILGSW